MSTVLSLPLAENDASAIERLDINVDIHDNSSPEELSERVATLFNQMFALDMSVKASQVSVDRLTDGFTNLVYSVTVDPAPMVPTEQQQQETTCFHRATAAEDYADATQIGPQIYGIFENGRLEEFFESTTLTRDDIRNASTSRQIAQRVCELHTLVGHHRPFSGDAEKQNNGTTALYLSKKPDLWTNVDTMMGVIQSKWPEIRRECDANVQCAEILDNWHQVEQAVHKFKTYIEKDVHSPILFAHNDLAYDNILRLEGSGEIILIDYEYAGFNYRGFDIANHLYTWKPNSSYSETPHILDLARYPTVEQRHNFLRAYILA
ncbi:hypothetical protein LPJ59_006154 [Coemansia sp. RSA 2399]|nr:hypothetical protein LPJ59_006154 [Coemansia sp. RSA 2399]